MSAKYKHIFAFGAGIICLIVYILTLNPTVTFMDSGELAAACTSFGIPHPTGYPLFLILGFIFSKLPFSASPVYNLNLMSAVISAAAVIIFYYVSFSVISLLTVRQSKQEQKHKKGKAQSNEINISANVVKLASFFSALVFGFSRTFWSNALSVEVYPLHALLQIILLYYCIRIYSSLKEGNKKNWILLFVFLGLSFANHMTTVFVVPGILYLFYLQHKENPAFAKSVYPIVFWTIPGLLLYLVLILRASSEPFMNWSDPKTLSNLYHHITGGDYSQLMFASSNVFSKNTKLFFSTVLGEYAVVSGIIAVIGLGYLYTRSKHLFYFIIILILGCLLYSLNYSIRDLLTYFLLIYILLGLTYGVGFIYVLNFLSSKVNLQKNFIPVLVIGGLLLSGFSLNYNYSANNNSANYVIEDITLNTFNEIELNSVLMTYDWGYIYPAAVYYQQVAKVRQDVKVFNVKFLSVAWYLNMIKKYYLDVYSSCKEEIDGYITSQGDEKARVTRLASLVKAFITKNFAKFPFYMTFDFAYSKEMKPLISEYGIQPSGLVYKLVNKNSVYDRTAGLNSLQAEFRKYERGTQEKEKVNLSTAGVYYDNAVYHATNKNPLLALRFLDKALDLRSDFKEALTLKNQLLKEK